MNKYRNKKTIIDGIQFDSKKEAKVYQQYKLLERAGEIKDLKLQPRYELQPSFKKNGKTYRRIDYFADLSYFDVKNDKLVVCDVKRLRNGCI